MATYVVTTSSTGVVECAKSITPILREEGAILDAVNINYVPASRELSIELTKSDGTVLDDMVVLPEFATLDKVPASCAFNNTTGKMEFKNSAGAVLFVCAIQLPLCP